MIVWIHLANLGLRIFHSAIYRLIDRGAFDHRWELATQTMSDDYLLVEILKMDLREVIKVKKEKAACDRGLHSANTKEFYGTKQS